jgi:hypothetical protein
MSAWARCRGWWRTITIPADGHRPAHADAPVRVGLPTLEPGDRVELLPPGTTPSDVDRAMARAAEWRRSHPDATRDDVDTGRARMHPNGRWEIVRSDRYPVEVPPLTPYQALRAAGLWPDGVPGDWREPAQPAPAPTWSQWSTAVMDTVGGARITTSRASFDRHLAPLIEQAIQARTVTSEASVADDGTGSEVGP